MTIEAGGDANCDALVPADVIVIGGGIAGLTVALNLGQRRVCLLTKTALDEGAATHWAQGGIAAAVGQNDSAALHAKDTIAVSGDLADADRVNILTQEGPEAVKKLIEWGVRFDKDSTGNYQLGREAAHSCSRILHANDATGAELMRTLLSQLRSKQHILRCEHSTVIQLIKHRHRVVGVLALEPSGKQVRYYAPAVVLATGGIGQLYSHNSNPVEATGDGLALAADAGAWLADLAFVQFHPTALAVGLDPMPLITEALRGAGAQLVNKQGERFMLSVHPDAELAPRDVVARAIWKVLAENTGESVYLDARPHLVKQIEKKFPTIFKQCQNHGINPQKDLIPVAPAAHYHMGGVWVNAEGQTSLSGLWACGEVCATGIHGANRLASNSLLEAIVFGRRVAENVIRSSGGDRSMYLIENKYNLPRSLVSVGHGQVDQQLYTKMRQIMWEEVGLIRQRASLEEATHFFLQYKQLSLSLSLRHSLLVSYLIAQDALRRSESRGSHYRSDFPYTDPRWRCR